MAFLELCDDILRYRGDRHFSYMGVVRARQPLNRSAHSRSAFFREASPNIFNFRCRADRSMPMKFAVFEILPEKRLICTFRYSRSKLSLASLKGDPINEATPWSRSSSLPKTSGGSISTSIFEKLSLGARIIVRSMTFRNCLTFPGQSQACSAAIASSEISGGCKRWSAANRAA